MQVIKRILYVFLIVASLFIVFSCDMRKEATEDDNKDIRKILKDANFLYRNFFAIEDSVKTEDSKNNIYTIKLRAEEDYEYNTAVVKVSKEKDTFYSTVAYDLDLNQSKGNLKLSGEFITSSDVDSLVDNNIIEKLIKNSDRLSRITLNGVSFKPDSVSMDIF